MGPQSRTPYPRPCAPPVTRGERSRRNSRDAHPISSPASLPTTTRCRFLESLTTRLPPRGYFYQRIQFRHLPAPSQIVLRRLHALGASIPILFTRAHKQAMVTGRPMRTCQSHITALGNEEMSRCKEQARSKLRSSNDALLSKKERKKIDYQAWKIQEPLATFERFHKKRKQKARNKKEEAESQEKSGWSELLLCM